MELKKRIDDGEQPKAIFRAYPFVDYAGKRLWQERFSSKRSVDEFNKNLLGDVWQREYLLQLLPGRIIRLDDLPYDKADDPELPPEQVPVIKKMQKYQIRSPEIRESGIILGRRDRR